MDMKGKMDIKKKIVRILVESIKEVEGINIEKIGEIFQYTGQTVRNWLSEKSTIKNAENIITGLRRAEFAEREKLKERFLEKLWQEDIALPYYLQEQLKFEDVVEYLLKNYEQAEDMFHSCGIINELKNNKAVESVMYQKMQLNEIRYGFFKVEKCSETYAILKFWDLESDFGYKVLVSFWREYNIYGQSGYDSGRISEKRKKEYGVDMILEFSFEKERQDALSSYMKNAVYIDYISVEEMKNQTIGKDFVYAREVGKTDELILANQFADMIISHMTKFFFVIYKNVYFRKRKKSDRSGNEKWILGNMKQMQMNQIKFEAEILKNQLKNEKNELLVILGFLGFSMISELGKRFKRIVCLDNANECISMYELYGEEIETGKVSSEEIENIEFAIFTSAIADYISEEYGLLGQADVVIVGLGSTSFSRSVKKYTKYINAWLKPEGIVLFSFFNEKFPYDYLSKNEIMQNCTYVPLTKQDRAVVTSSEMISKKNPEYYVYCKLYNATMIQELMANYFEMIKMYSYPLLAFSVNKSLPFLQKISEKYDYEQSINGMNAEDISPKSYSSFRGFYVGLVAKKVLGQGAKVFNSEKYRRADRREDCRILKTVLLKDQAEGNIYVILLGVKDRLQENEEGEVVIGGRRLRFMNIKEVNQLGFEIGNVPPFFAIENLPDYRLKRYCGIDIANEGKQMYIIESGSPKKKIILTNVEFTELLREYRFVDIQC